MLETIRKVYELYGFEPVETPAIEYTDALGKFLPDQDRPNEGVFSFQDDDEQWLSLRYDLTAPLARYVAEHFDTLPKPYRSYRAGWVFRNEKPGPGRYRQFMQFDADTVGSASPAADAEMCMMAADTMEALGIPRGSYVVRVNNRKVLDGVMEAIGLGGEANAGKRVTVLRAIDKLDRLGVEGVKLLLGPGRKDESGDFTKGAGLDGTQIIRVLSLVTTAPQMFALETEFTTRQQAEDFIANMPDTDRYSVVFNERIGLFGVLSNASTLANLRHRFSDNQTVCEGLDELQLLSNLTYYAGYRPDQISIDPSVVRGLEYYTGPVYEVELTFAMTGDDGKASTSAQPVRFGSVGGGGRYDGLIARFRGEPVPATGFSIGVSRLLAALSHLGKINTKPEPGPVIVTVFDQDRLADYQRMASELRKAGIHAELYLGAGRFGPQMKYADRRRSPCVVIQGSDEKQKGEVQIKDLILGAELAGLSKKRDDYLAKQAAAQFAVPESRLVEAVREVLARHAIA
jgi:histidyl-tRNA synthetase